MHGFRSGTPASQRWQELACKKQQELDAQIAHLRAMRQLVDRVLNCKCAELPECGRLAASVIAAAAE